MHTRPLLILEQGQKIRNAKELMEKYTVTSAVVIAFGVHLDE